MRRGMRSLLCFGLGFFLFIASFQTCRLSPIIIRKHSPDIRWRLKPEQSDQDTHTHARAESASEKTFHSLRAARTHDEHTHKVCAPFDSKQHQKQHESNKLSNISAKIYLDWTTRNIECDGSFCSAARFYPKPIHFHPSLLAFWSAPVASNLQFQRIFSAPHRSQRETRSQVQSANIHPLYRIYIGRKWPLFASNK